MTENINIDQEIEEIKKEIIELNDVKQVLKKGRGRPKIIKKENNEEKKRKCKICNVEKNVDSFVVDRKLDNGQIRFKTKCLDCYKVLSKQYY